MTTPRTPLRKAWDEARGVVLAALLVGIAYNLFASSRVPWVRQLPNTGDTASYEDLVGGAPSDTARMVVTDTASRAALPGAAVDTVVLTSPGDSAAARQAEEQRLARVRDSLRLADLEMKRIKDSIAKAQATTAAPPAETLQKEIGTATARRLFDEKKARFIDARPAEQFAKGHIPGAINVYANDFQNHIPELLPIPKDELIVAYCGGGLCELSHELADNLRLLGFKRVVVYTGGTTDWNANNYPFTSGE